MIQLQDSSFSITIHLLFKGQQQNTAPAHSSTYTIQYLHLICFYRTTLFNSFFGIWGQRPLTQGLRFGYSGRREKKADAERRTKHNIRFWADIWTMKLLHLLDQMFGSLVRKMKIETVVGIYGNKVITMYENQFSSNCNVYQFLWSPAMTYYLTITFQSKLCIKLVRSLKLSPQRHCFLLW